MRYIAHRCHANREQRKMLFSIAANFLTRVPGAVGLLWFLPLLHTGLGTAGYANLFSAMALAVSAGFLSGGVAIVGRRLIGEAYAKGDRQAEADHFMTSMVANTMAGSLAMVIAAAYCGLTNADNVYLMVSLIAAGGFVFNMIDNLRTAYNEHYVTACLLIVLQTTGFTIGFLVSYTRENAIISVLVLQGPYWLAALISFVLMLRYRGYLLRGRPVHVWDMLRQGLSLAIADGLLMTTLSLSVVWLQYTTSAETSAWYATIVRLFQTLLMPVLLVLTPFSGYMRLRWHGKTIAQQQSFAKLTLGLGIGYGAFVSIALYIASRLYVSQLLHLPVPANVAIFLLFAAIITYRSYSSIAYVVLEEVTHLSTWTTIATSVAILLAVIASFSIQPMDAVSVYAVAAGVLLTGVTCWNAGRFICQRWAVS